MQTISIIVADDHHIVRGGITALLQGESDFKILAECGDGLETLRLVETLKPDVLVTDIEIPGISGLEVASRVVTHFPDTKVVILSMYESEVFVQSALKAGVMAYVLKDSGPDELKAAIRNAARGIHYLSPPLSERALQYYIEGSKNKEQSGYDSLTEREREVLQLLVQGYNNAQVAEKLVISRRTAETHRANLMRKLGAANQTELMRLAIQIDVIQPMVKPRKSETTLGETKEED